jgi:hypothetical protein
MTGREMYERWCDAQLQVPDWWRLTETRRLACDRLAEDVIADIESQEAA